MQRGRKIHVLNVYSKRRHKKRTSQSSALLWGVFSTSTRPFARFYLCCALRMREKEVEEAGQDIESCRLRNGNLVSHHWLARIRRSCWPWQVRPGVGGVLHFRCFFRLFPRLHSRTSSPSSRSSSKAREGPWPLLRPCRSAEISCLATMRRLVFEMRRMSKTASCSSCEALHRRLDDTTIWREVAPMHL